MIPATFPLATTSTAESVAGWERMKADLLCFLEVFLAAMVGAGVHHGEGGGGNAGLLLPGIVNAGRIDNRYTRPNQMSH